MERHCPICGHRMTPHEIVCGACRTRIEQREPVRREQALGAWGQGLMLCLALFLFAKGALATFGPSEYQSLVRSLGFDAADATAHYLNAAFVSAAALLYAIAWIGGYLGLKWDVAVCLSALAVFVGGQAVTQFVFVRGDGGVARALALFVVWVAVPVFQFAALALGVRHEQPPTEGEESQPQPADETV